jgi:hypothetical protein
MGFDQWNQRLAARLSPRQAGWVVIGILLVAAVGPWLLGGAMVGGLKGVWFAIQDVGLMAALAIFLMAEDGPPRHHRKSGIRR